MLCMKLRDGGRTKYYLEMEKYIGIEGNGKTI